MFTYRIKISTYRILDVCCTGQNKQAKEERWMGVEKKRYDFKKTVREIKVGLCFVFVAVITNMHLQTFFIFWRISARRHLQSAPPISCFEQRGLRPLDRSSSRDSRKLTSLDPVARIPDRLQHQRRCRRSVTLNEFTKGGSARPDPPLIACVLSSSASSSDEKGRDWNSHRPRDFNLHPTCTAVVSSQDGGHWRPSASPGIDACLPVCLCICVYACVPLCVHVCLYVCVCTDACMIDWCVVVGSGFIILHGLRC